jgi:hypothetical protein
MKLFNFLKLKKNRVPSLESLRPLIFDADWFWFASLGLFFVIFVATAFVGLKLSYAQYFESYKESQPTENNEGLINQERLKKTINKRVEFLNGEFSLPKDPSL